MLGSLILYLKAMRILMFQLSGFYYKGLRCPFFSVVLSLIRVPLTGTCPGLVEGSLGTLSAFQGFGVEGFWYFQSQISQLYGIV